jgi:hypothetical protein
LELDKSFIKFAKTVQVSLAFMHLKDMMRNDVRGRHIENEKNKEKN